MHFVCLLTQQRFQLKKVKAYAFCLFVYTTFLDNKNRHFVRFACLFRHFQPEIAK